MFFDVSPPQPGLLQNGESGAHISLANGRHFPIPFLNMSMKSWFVIAVLVMCFAGYVECKRWGAETICGFQKPYIDVAEAVSIVDVVAVHGLSLQLLIIRQLGKRVPHSSDQLSQRECIDCT